jgi:DNA-binding response OmpR family regulator
MKTHETSVCALLLGEYGDGRSLIHQVFHDAGWILLEAHDRNEALKQLQRELVQVVITSSEFTEWDWKKLLNNLLRRPKPPQLIVTSPTADEHLWSEVLNCGGYDVLPEPFRRDEVERVVAAARRHYGPPQVRTAGGSIRQPGAA